MVCSFIHCPVTSCIYILSIADVLFSGWRLTKFLSDCIVIGFVCIAVSIPGIMISPFFIQWIYIIFLTLPKVEDVFFHTCQRRYCRDSHFVTKHLLFDFEHHVVVVWVRIPCVIRCTLIGCSRGKVGFHIRSKFIHIPAITWCSYKWSCWVEPFNVFTQWYIYLLTYKGFICNCP